MHATAKINEATLEPLASSGRVKARYAKFRRSGKIGVRFGVRLDPLTRKPLLHLQIRMEPVVGLEPTTCSLRMSCSTTELNWPVQK